MPGLNMRPAVAVSSQANRLRVASPKQLVIFTRIRYKARAGPPQNHETAIKRGDGALERLGAAFQTVSAAWSKLDTQQRVYTVVAGAAVLAATPQVLTFVVILLERLLVGGLLAVEGALAGLLLASTRLVVLAGTLALAATGAYLFLFKKQREP